MLIFKHSLSGRTNPSQAPSEDLEIGDIPPQLLREDEPQIPSVSELQVVRHYTRLSQKNFSIDTNFYPLGSCTMKYNPRACNKYAMLPGFLNRHPYSSERTGQGFLTCMYELQQMLMDITGMRAVSLCPLAGAQGEFTGVTMIRAYHESRGDTDRTEILVPDAAHGTNPATATMCGYQVKEIPTTEDGDVDVDILRQVVGPKTAGLMLTNPSTLGVFERRILEVEKIVHSAGGLLYYDGANLNAIMGKVKPGDMGFDVIHMNLHKTFSTPHGGGGPGAGPVGVNDRLLPFLPIPYVVEDNNEYRWAQEEDCPRSIGRLSANMGNAGVLIRAYIYARLLGREGMQRVAEFATLNANYMMRCMQERGVEMAYPDRYATHEFIVTLKSLKDSKDVSAMDVAKRLLDKGHHAPTVYFPLLVPECFLIEPTETESKQELDSFIGAFIEILEEANSDPELLQHAPHTTPVRRLDEVRAARELDVIWRDGATD